MKYYLSSYKFGDNIQDLKRLQPANKKLGHINNSRDWVGADPKRAVAHQFKEMEFLDELGFQSEALDLKMYFGRAKALKEKLDSLGAIWVSGGNTFVLRQAMKLSGFDQLFPTLMAKKNFLYGGYSAGICVLSNTLKPIDIVDEPNNFPYEGIHEAIYEGLGVFDYSFMPHYDSHHFESEVIGKEIQRCIDNKWLFKALRDGDVLIIE